MSRAPVDEIVAYNLALLAEERVVRRDGERGASATDLTAEAVSRKVEALGRSPFEFFRGTFHLMARDLLLERVAGSEPRAPEGLVVGDLHLENFGTFRGSSGELCFDVNDFDEVGWAPIDLDLRRVCSSAMLLPSLPAAAAAATARAVAGGWADGIERLGGRFPVAAWTREHASGVVRRLLDEGEEKRPRDLAEKVAPGKRHDAFGDGGSPPKYQRPERRWVRVVERALEEYLRSLEQLKARLPGGAWTLLDVAYRFKGTGSLGRLRFDALLGRGAERTVIEFKEARPSALDEARGTPAGPPRARVQTAAIRRLQGDPWPRVASTRLGTLSALGREVEPGERKLSIEAFASEPDPRREELLAYARQCGELLARLHCRANAPLLLNSSWSTREAAESAVAFAASYAKVVRADFAAFRAARAKRSFPLTGRS